MKSMKAQSLDNLSVVMIGFNGFYNSLEKGFNYRFNQIVNDQSPTSRSKGKLFTAGKKNETNS